ncbi:MAG: hypothetical protein KAG97_07040, partial [Victivallales bacterium]|nr:hypothetical protein [Victivallales bacterium]
MNRDGRSIDIKGCGMPDGGGHFGQFGGKYVPETLVPVLEELERVYAKAIADTAFVERYDSLLADFVGRPTPLYYAERLSEHLGGPRIYLKREDLCHT